MEIGNLVSLSPVINIPIMVRAFSFSPYNYQEGTKLYYLTENILSGLLLINIFKVFFYYCF